MTQQFSDWSNVLIYIAMAVYAAAFIAFAMDLANRSATRAKQGTASVVRAAAGAVTRPGAAAGPGTAAGSGTLTLERGGDAAVTATRDAAPGLTVRELRADDAEQWVDERAGKALRAGMWLTGLGFVFHLAADVLRGIAAERVPWSNMYEFSMTSTLLIVLVFLAAQLWNDLRFLGTFITGFVTLLLGVAAVGFYVEIGPLQPALQSAWLVIHVFVASLATGCLALGCGLSIAQLAKHRRTARLHAGKRVGLRFLNALPSEERLEDLAYRIIVVGFILWTFTLIAGAIWAQRAWGRYWGWDTKEVWTFIIWTVFAGYIHARATKGWRGVPSAWLAVVGFATVMFNFTIVNIFFKGLHTYSGL